ncbi:MAG: translation initiation factor [Oscillatoriales cyanobacterium]|nr:MAG: translation initiation factor [Oscillatoriales cyanobacterium]
MPNPRRRQDDRANASTRQNSATQRVVYSEFGPNANTEAIARAVPDLPPAQQTLKVQISRKGRGGKTVTVISGFQHKPETLQALLKTLKNRCGTGGTLKDDTIEIQGDYADRLVTLLTEQGYKAKRSGG